MQVFVSVVEMETPKKTRITMGITVSFNNSTCKKVINYLKQRYEIKTKMVHEQWLQLKLLFLLGYNLKIVI